MNEWWVNIGFIRNNLWQQWAAASYGDVAAKQCKCSIFIIGEAGRWRCKCGCGSVVMLLQHLKGSISCHTGKHSSLLDIVHICVIMCVSVCVCIIITFVVGWHFYRLCYYCCCCQWCCSAAVGVAHFSIINPLGIEHETKVKFIIFCVCDTFLTCYNNKNNDICCSKSKESFSGLLALPFHRYTCTHIHTTANPSTVVKVAQK